MGNGAITHCCQRPTPQVSIAALTVRRDEEEKKETPNGYARFYAGVRTNQNKYTCPLLAIHTWNLARQNLSVQHGQLDSLQQPGSTWLDRSKSSTILSQAGRKDQAQTDHDENIQVIPVEDILRINISTEVKRTVEQNKTVRLKTPPPEELGCCDSVKKCCLKNVCCWCHKEKKVAPQHITQTTERLEATRKIVVTIEYLRYGLVHTPSTISALSKEKQQEFYDKKKGEATLKFYYLHNEDFHNNQYQKELDESEAFARVVMQIKAMKDDYPEPAQLQQIVAQQHMKLFGYEPREHVPGNQGTSQLVTTIAVRKTTDDD